MKFKNFWNRLLKKGDDLVYIEGERCYIRTFQEQDAHSLTELVRNNKYFWSTYEPLHRQEYYTIETQYKKILESIHLMQLKREFSFGIYMKTTSQLIGHISLYAIKRLPYLSGFVGYSVDEKFVGQGIATEAVRLILKFAFVDVHLHRVEAYVSPKNIPSVKVLEKAGLVREGVLRQLLYINGVWEDHYMYAMLQEDYLASY